jgi:hypothetical protein
MEAARLIKSKSLRSMVEWEIGPVYETRAGPESLRWSMTVTAPMARFDREVVCRLARMR